MGMIKWVGGLIAGAGIKWLWSSVGTLVLAAAYTAGVWTGVHSKLPNVDPYNVYYHTKDGKRGSMIVFKHEGETYYPSHGINTLLELKGQKNIKLRRF